MTRGRTFRRGLLIAWLSAAAAWAHEGAPPEPHDLWSAWSMDPAVVVLLGVSALFYARGTAPGRGLRGWEQWCFWWGWFSLAVALVSPLHALGEALFSAHMAQHEVLMAVAAPLLVLGRPMVPFLWAMPEGTRRRVGRWAKAGWWAAVWRFLTRPLTAWMVHAVALWIWHIPRLFEATLTSDLVHSLQHFSFLFSALLFWWALFREHGQPSQGGAGLFYVFTTAMHTGVLGAMLTFSPAVWYPVYRDTTEPWGLSPLEDQQLGGLIMWVPASLTYVAAGVVLFLRWIRASERPWLREQAEVD